MTAWYEITDQDCAITAPAGADLRKLADDQRLRAVHALGRLIGGQVCALLVSSPGSVRVWVAGCDSRLTDEHVRELLAGEAPELLTLAFRVRRGLDLWSMLEALDSLPPEDNRFARLCLARSITISREALSWLAADLDPAVRAGVAGNPIASRTVRAVLSADEDRSVREAICRSR